MVPEVLALFLQSACGNTTQIFPPNIQPEIYPDNPCLMIRREGAPPMVASVLGMVRNNHLLIFITHPEVDA